ncbi:nose resistant to fluoxetine protein 6-like [Bombyx mandarina]|uniref:Nose resistant to fluoxetine protein 6-like n=1 Tax=Bombyx mandarina TaxID=7092 RepID=A0A6J2K0R9_BOMMA|nr:nose resistant to fluoxetine protein 6-like [Bombyx mandarina]
MSVLVLLLVSTAAHGLSDEEYSRFPRLFHLDDYDTCLSQPGGLYCVGSFHITPVTPEHPTYELMKEYSEHPSNFNRTVLYRGYCVSSRCGTASETNTSLRFEQCANRWGEKYAFRLSLQKLQYCRSFAQEFARKNTQEPMDEPQKIFLSVVCALLFFNFIGTAYDLLLGDERKKSKHLVSWSLRSNWNRLIATYEDGDPRLSALNPVQGVRVFLMSLTILTHSGVIRGSFYVFNPRFIEEIVKSPLLMLFFNGTTLIQFFLVMSNFLLAYNLLLASKTHELKLKHLPLCILKRIARIAPVYLLVVGYSATWWPYARSGPLWPTLVEAESAVCRKKFWFQAFFINNLVQAEEHCLVQTWFLAVDMQLYILGSALTLYLASRRDIALKVLGALFVSSLLLNAGLAYAFDWQALVYFATPENIRNMYLNVPSFSRLYTSPWGSLPACFIGLFLAHVHFELQEKGLKKRDISFVVNILYQLAPLVLVFWVLSGTWLREFSTRGFVAFYVALERMVFSCFCALILFGMFNGGSNILKEFSAWRGWHAMGRMSLSVLMLHWCVNTIIAHSRLQPSTTTVLDVFADFAATGFYTYLLAIPLTLLVEMPIQRFISGLIL